MFRLVFFIHLIFLTFSSLQAEGEPVVCIHGYFRSSTCMIPMSKVLKRAGLKVHLWGYRCKTETIEGHAEDLVEVLNKIAKSHPGEPIHFTTHSFGGIILRSAVNHPDCPTEARIGRAVLLAPPNQGACIARRLHASPLVRWYLGKRSGKQLLTYNGDAMESVGQFPESMDVMVIAGNKDLWLYNILAPGAEGANDGRVRVDETYLTTPHEHHVIPFGHNKIARCRESFILTTRFLLSS